MMVKKLYQATAVAMALALTAMLAGCGVEPNARAGDTPSSGTDPVQGTGGSDATTDSMGCLYGTWTADNAFFLSAIREFGDEVKSVAGEVIVTFADDGTLTTEYREWLITAVSEGIEVTITRTGTDRGVFAATERTVTLEDTELGSSLVVSAAGTDMTIAPAPATYTDAPYTCDVSTAAITTTDGTLQLLR